MSKPDEWSVSIQDGGSETGPEGIGSTLGKAARRAVKRLIRRGAYADTFDASALHFRDGKFQASRTGTVTISGTPGAWAWTFEWDETPNGEEVTVG